MRADECALITLDAVLGMPQRSGNGNAALLICSCALRELTVLHSDECGNGEAVAVHLGDRTNDAVNEVDDLGTLADGCGLCGGLTGFCPVCGNIYVNESACAELDSLVVLSNDLVAELGVGLGCLLLHVGDSVVLRHNVCKCEECRLKDGILDLHVADIVSCNARCVDDIEVDIVLCNVALDRCGEHFAELIGTPLAVEQEGSAGLDIVNDLKALVQVCNIVAGNEVSLSDVVGSLDGLIAEAQVRDSHAARFL